MLFWSLVCATRRCRVFAPAGEALSCRATRKYPKKRALLPASPSLRYGATCGARAWAAPRNSLRACALRSNRRGESVHDAVALYGATASPRPVLLGAGRRGLGYQTGHRCARPCLWGRAQRWPVRMFGCWHPTPFACACGVAFARWQLHRRVQLLRDLTCRVCLNGARKRAVSYAAHLANVTTQVAP